VFAEDHRLELRGRRLELERQQIINQSLGINVGGGSGMQSTSSQESRQGLLGLLGI
jgi:hypothetical protein